jgi:hypothetical protein
LENVAASPEATLKLTYHALFKSNQLEVQVPFPNVGPKTGSMHFVLRQEFCGSAIVCNSTTVGIRQSQWFAKQIAVLLELFWLLRLAIKIVERVPSGVELPDVLHM